VKERTEWDKERARWEREWMAAMASKRAARPAPVTMDGDSKNVVADSGNEGVEKPQVIGDRPTTDSESITSATDNKSRNNSQDSVTAQTDGTPPVEATIVSPDHAESLPSASTHPVALHFTAEDAISSGSVAETNADVSEVANDAVVAVNSAASGETTDAGSSNNLPVDHQSSVLAANDGFPLPPSNTDDSTLPAPPRITRPPVPMPAVPTNAPTGLFSRVFGWWGGTPLSSNLAQADGELVVSTQFVFPPAPGKTRPGDTASARGQENVARNTSPGVDGGRGRRDSRGSNASVSSTTSFHVSLPSSFLGDADAAQSPEDAVNATRAQKKGSQTKFSYALPALMDNDTAVSSGHEHGISPSLSLTSFLSEEQSRQ